jgi:mannose-6-phosphate isomerase-like protein (cupin superfamily)
VVRTNGTKRDLVIEKESLPGGENAVVFDGHEHGSSVSFFITRNKPGMGPSLHKHPYDETFIVQEGEACFTVGEETVEATAGEVLVVPANTPHGFVNVGEGRLRMVNIHPVPQMETEWLQ